MTDQDLRMFCLQESGGDVANAKVAYEWLNVGGSTSAPHVEQLIALMAEGGILNPVDVTTSKGERWVYYSSKVGWELCVNPANDAAKLDRENWGQHDLN